MPGARVVVEHVCRRYGDALVLDDVGFVVEPGELVALSGRSGSGKTTLLQLIGSLDKPTRGSTRVDDIEVEQLHNPARYRREVVGFVFQLHHLLPSLSAQHSAQPVKRPQETVRVLVIERQWRPDLEHVADASGRNQYLPFAEFIDHASG